MVKGKPLLATLAAILAGCSSIPDLPNDEPASLANLADKIECEIYRAYKSAAKPSDIDFSKWAVVYTITQNATDTAAVGFDPLSWLSPARVDKLVYSGSANLEREAYRNGKAEYSVFVANTSEKTCEPDPAVPLVKVFPADFKLRDWVNQVALARNKDQLSSFSYSVRVQVTTGGGIGPDFEDGKWTAKAGVSAKRMTVNTVDFAFLPIPEKPKPQQVIVVAPIPQAPKDKAGPETLVPKKRVLKKPSATELPARVPEYLIERSRGITQGQQLDRVTPDGILDR